MIILLIYSSNKKSICEISHKCSYFLDSSISFLISRSISSISFPILPVTFSYNAQSLPCSDYPLLYVPTCYFTSSNPNMYMLMLSVTPARGATLACYFHQSTLLYFNPHSHEGSDSNIPQIFNLFSNGILTNYTNPLITKFINVLF